MKKVLAREMSERYDRTFMSKDTRKLLKQSLKKLDKGKSHSSQQNQKLDYEALNHNITPYKLRLIEQSQKLHYNPRYMENTLSKPGYTR